jgi:hypothetical protein
MKTYRRPWWLVVNKPAGLVTTVQEEFKPGEQIFIIRGEPLVQGLAWLTWGPVGALLIVLILTWLAIVLNVREQPRTIQALFIVAFLGLPALAWAGVALTLNRLSEKHLQAERQAEAEECVIRLNQKQRELFYQTGPSSPEKKVAYDHIRQARVAQSIDGRKAKAQRLILETREETVVLLSEALGTLAQKIDLAHKIQAVCTTPVQQ